MTGSEVAIIVVSLRSCVARPHPRLDWVWLCETRPPRHVACSIRTASDKRWAWSPENEATLLQGLKLTGNCQRDLKVAPAKVVSGLLFHLYLRRLRFCQEYRAWASRRLTWNAKITASPFLGHLYLMIRPTSCGVRVTLSSHMITSWYHLHE